MLLLEPHSDPRSAAEMDVRGRVLLTPYRTHHHGSPFAEAGGGQDRDIEQCVGRGGVGERDESPLQTTEVADEDAAGVAFEERGPVDADLGCDRIASLK